jgi:hypothetical protein
MGHLVPFVKIMTWPDCAFLTGPQKAPLEFCPQRTGGGTERNGVDCRRGTTPPKFSQMFYLEGLSRLNLLQMDDPREDPLDVCVRATPPFLSSAAVMDWLHE